MYLSSKSIIHYQNKYRIIKIEKKNQKNYHHCLRTVIPFATHYNNDISQDLWWFRAYNIRSILIYFIFYYSIFDEMYHTREYLAKHIMQDSWNNSIRFYVDETAFHPNPLWPLKIYIFIMRQYENVYDVRVYWYRFVRLDVLRFARIAVMYDVKYRVFPSCFFFCL